MKPVDTSGAPAGFVAASALVRPRGTLVVKSTFHGETPVSFSPLVVDEITVIGSRCGPFARAIDLLSRGRVAVTALAAGPYPLAQFAAAFDRWRPHTKARPKIPRRTAIDADDPGASAIDDSFWGAWGITRRRGRSDCGVDCACHGRL